MEKIPFLSHISFETKGNELVLMCGHWKLMVLKVTMHEMIQYSRHAHI